MMSMGVYPGHALFKGSQGSMDRGGQRRSFNTKLERKLSEFYSLPRNMTSKEILSKLDEESAKRDQEKETQKAKKEEELFKKLGIKAPTGLTPKSSRRIEGVIADLQKYRLGNVKSRKDRGMTEELQNILYPPPAPAVQPPIPIHYSQFPSPAQYESDYSHLSPTYHPEYYTTHTASFQSPKPPVVPQQPEGWSWTHEGGWIYRLPPDAPPPSLTYGADQPFESSPRNIAVSSEFLAFPNQAEQYYTTAQPPRHSSPSPYSLKPRSILKSSGTDSSRTQWTDPTSSPRQVRFKETIDIAPSHFLSRSPVVARPAITTRSPQGPQGTLNQRPVDKRRSMSLDCGSQMQPRPPQIPASSPSHHRVKVHANTTQQAPPTLREAHHRLLNFDDQRNEVSGKRSGRNLIRELERMAEHAPPEYTPRQRFQDVEHKRASESSDGSMRETGYAAGTQKEQRSSPHSSNGAAQPHSRRPIPPVSQNPDRSGSFYPMPSQESFQPHGGFVSEDGSSDRASTPRPLHDDDVISQKQGLASSRHYSVPRRHNEDDGQHLTNDTDYFDVHSASQNSQRGLRNGSQTSGSSSRRRTFAIIEDDADMPNRPSPSPPPEVEELEDQYPSRSRSVSPEQPSPKRFKLTDGAWIRYDIPSDKLPPAPAKVRVAKRPDHRTRYGRVKSEPLSQVSQIEAPEDSQDRQEDGYNQDETIESNWSCSQNERLGRIIEEKGEEHEEEEAIRWDSADTQPFGEGAWAEPGFFDKTEKLPFRIWRDGY